MHIPDLEALNVLVAEHAPGLIVIDPMARCIPGADENSAWDVGTMLAALDRLRHRSGACVLMAHHSGKDGSRGMRGSSALLGAVDTAISCQRTREGVTALVTKQKNGSDGEALRFRLRPRADSAVLELISSGSAAEPWRPTVLMESDRTNRHDRAPAI